MKHPRLILLFLLSAVATDAFTCVAAAPRSGGIIRPVFVNSSRENPTFRVRSQLVRPRFESSDRVRSKLENRQPQAAPAREVMKMQNSYVQPRIAPTEYFVAHREAIRPTVPHHVHYVNNNYRVGPRYANKRETYTSP